MTERAGVYGGSLYDLAAEENLTEPIMNDLFQIRQVFRDNQDYLKLLAEPSIKKEERLGLIEQAFGSGQMNYDDDGSIASQLTEQPIGAGCERYVVNFIKLLCERDMLGEYEGCCESYQKRYNADHNIAEAVVTSAVALSSEQLAKLGKKLEEMSGKTISLTQKLDPKVLAGIKVELEGRQLDGTLSGRLTVMQKKLSETIA